MHGEIRGEARGQVRVEMRHVGSVVFPPEPADAVILHIHADRQLANPRDTAVTQARRLALATGSVVVSARYRITYPASLDDVQVAYDYCRALGPVAVVGERLGAGLAAAMLLRLRDAGAEPPQCAVLVAALLDMTLDARSLQLNAGTDPSFDVAELRRLTGRYTGRTARTNPLLSPLYGNLHGLPPIRLLAAGTDPFLDDSLGFAARAARSGVRVDLHVRPDERSLSTDAVPAAADFIRSHTQPAGPVARSA